VVRTESASRLQKGRIMKSVSVLFVAVLLLSGCGVGYDDQNWTDDGQPVAQQKERLTGDEEPQGEPGVDLKGTEPQEKTESGSDGCGTVALPQDPIPLFPGRPTAPSAPTPVPAPDPRLVPQVLPGR